MCGFVYVCIVCYLHTFEFRKPSKFSTYEIIVYERYEGGNQ